MSPVCSRYLLAQSPPPPPSRLPALAQGVVINQLGFYQLHVKPNTQLSKGAVLTDHKKHSTYVGVGNSLLTTGPSFVISTVANLNVDSNLNFNPHLGPQVRAHDLAPSSGVLIRDPHSEPQLRSDTEP